MFNNYNPFEMLDFQKILTAAKLPNVDMNSDVVISSQKKTMEALAAASKAVFEGVNAFSKKQVEILNAAVNEVKEATSELAKGNTQQSATKSIELAKEAIEKAQANTGVIELTGTVRRDGRGRGLLEQHFRSCLDFFLTR